MTPLGKNLLNSRMARKLLRADPQRASKPAQQLPLAHVQTRGKLLNARRRVTPQARRGATNECIELAWTHVSAQKVRYGGHSLKAGRRLRHGLQKELDFVSIEYVI